MSTETAYRCGQIVVNGDVANHQMFKEKPVTQVEEVKFKSTIIIIEYFNFSDIKHEQ